MQTDTPNVTPENKNSSFGMRLKTAREAMGLERKDIAAQLRLNEKYLVMMEKDRFAPDLPLTFVRGYLKTYAKFLQIPEFETKKALDSIKPRPGGETLPFKNMPQSRSGNYFTQLFTYLVVFGLVGIGGAWWYTHPNGPAELLAEAQANFGKTKAPAVAANAEPAAPVITPQETTAAATTTTGITETTTTNGANNTETNTGLQATTNKSTDVPVGADIDKAIDKTISAHIETKSHAANTKPAYMSDGDDGTLNVDDGTLTTNTNDTD